MPSSWKYVEKCRLLGDMSRGLLCRLHASKELLGDSSRCPACLTSKEYSKIRDRLEKSFPDSADLSKVSGYDSFQQNCKSIAADLYFFNELLQDISDFRKAAVFLLKDIAASTLHHFKLDQHRSIVLLFFDLLSGYYRVMTLLSLISERKTVMATYTTANAMAAEATDVVGVSDAVVLFNSLTHGHRLFIDDFFLHAEFVGSMMLEFYESIVISSNTENLRSKYVLNPSNDGDNMTHPVKMPLSLRPDRLLAMHTELRDVSIYLEHIAIGFIVCPSLLFHPESKYMELFRVAVTDQLVVTLHREMNINIHAEFESIYSSYPSKKDTINVPKGLKIKNVVKDMATTAVQSVGLKHRERRSFILAEIRNLLHISRALPGLIGPKFPIFVAAAAMARAEILHYFRHRPLECRKDVKKHLNSEHYYCSEITYLIEALYQLSCLVEEYKEIVVLYYGEYLSLCDAPTLEPLCKSALDELPETANPAISTIIMSLPSSARNATAEEDGNLEGFRINWDRYSTLLGTVWGKFAGQGNAALTAYMLEVRDRSEYIDNLSYLMKNYFLPCDVWWHKSALMESFEKGFKHAASPLSIFPAMSLGSLSIHEDYKIEAVEQSRDMRKFCDRLMNRISTQFTADLDTYWKLYDELEKKTLGKEAMTRLEKQYLLKQARDKAVASGKKDPTLSQPEQHPGYESEGWAIKNISALIEVRSRMLHLMMSVGNIGTFLLYDREYNIEHAIREALAYYFISKLKIIISQKEEISRPSVILKSIIVGCRVMQSLCDIVSFDLPQLLKSFLFSNFCDGTISPPGTVLLGQTPPSDGGLIWAIGHWFIKFVDEASAQNSGLMWVPSTNSFARSDSKQRPIDIFINNEEIMSLCSFIGPQGVRCIESMLIQVVTEKVATIKSFIATNKSVLQQFSSNMSNMSSLLGLDSSATFMAASVKAGVALAVREVLHLGLRDSMQVHSPFIKSSLATLTASVNPWEERDIITPLFSLASDAGVITEVDLSLVASLSPLVQTAEDKENFSLLPAAYAACFMMPYWTQNGIFLTEFGAFRGNQHCLALTMSKFILCFSSSQNAESSESLSHVLKSTAESFVELSANVILYMRDERSSFNSHPVRAYTNILELFLHYSPLMDHYSLEKYLPYAFIHASQMEISMGQVKGGDNLSAGMNRVIRAETVTTE